VLLLRIAGELSASHAIGVRLGSPEAEEIWAGLTTHWLLALAAQICAGLPSERSRELRPMVYRFLDRRCHVPRLLCLARELFKHRDDLGACWAWDAWISREPFSELEVAAIVLKDMLYPLIHEGLLDQWMQTECPVCLDEKVSQVRRATIWRSLHPCMHWLCDACEDKWTQRDGNSTCPICRTEIEFSRAATLLPRQLALGNTPPRRAVARSRTRRMSENFEAMEDVFAGIARALESPPRERQNAGESTRTALDSRNAVSLEVARRARRVARAVLACGAVLVAMLLVSLGVR